MKILNLYAGIGGNRKLWGNEHEIVAVENHPKIAAIYQDFFPADQVVVGDAHQYLLDHFAEFDFIWASPPCPTHSRVAKAGAFTAETGEQRQKISYPDMKLYEEILLLKGYFKGLWCVENVISWYEPLIAPQEINNHYFWTNFLIPIRASKTRKHHAAVSELSEFKGFDLTKYKGIDKRKALRNCVEPETAAHILSFATNPIKLQGALL